MSIEEKQSYLREVILEQGINPNDFFEYWQGLDLCTLLIMQNLKTLSWKD